MRTVTVEFPDEPGPGSVVLTERGVAYQRQAKGLAFMAPAAAWWWPAEAPDEENGAHPTTWLGLCTTGPLRVIYEPDAIVVGPVDLGPGGRDD